MARTLRQLGIKLKDHGKRHRKLLVSLAVLVLAYTLLGFFAAPWLVKKNAISAVRETYGAELKIEKVAINPFVLSISIDGVEMDDPSGAAFFKLKQFYANFQLSSLFRWAVTFAEIRFDAPELFVARDESGGLNLEFLVPGDTPAENDTAEDSSSIFRFITHEFSVNDASAHWNDAVPRQAVATTFGPVNLKVMNLNTLPQRSGTQDVVITTETAGTFSWSGSLQLNPLHSVGHAAIRGSHFGLVSAYIREDSGFEVVRGNADVELDYAIETLEDGTFQAQVDKLAFALTDVLVRTYGDTASDGSNADRDVLEIPSFRIDGGAARFPQRTVAVDSISLDDSVLSLYRDTNGKLNILPDSADGEPQPVDAPPASEDAGEPEWSVALNRLDVKRMAVGMIDDSVSPQADIGVDELNISISDISNAADSVFPIDVSMGTRSGGTITARGTVGALPGPVANLDVAAAGISLALLHPYIRPLADVSLDSGDLGMSVKLRSDAAEALSVTGDVAVTDFLVTETDEGTRLGSWKALSAKQIALSLGQKSLEISEVVFDKPYADIFIAQDGSANLGRVSPGRQSAEQPSSNTDEAATKAEEPAQGKELPIAVTIGRVVIKDASADFADLSLPLPFDVKIASLNGSLTTIASTSTEPSEIALEGKVDKYGMVKVSGTVTPLEPALNTDAKVQFKNIEMPKFSAYTVPFAGHEIERGKLDLDLGYKVTANELVGENKIVLRDFELGEKVEHPGAMSLPLGLAVALLKDPEGNIDIDLPVRGNLGDPEFRYGSVIVKALGNLIVKIVTSPFALLGKLVGAEADELEYISFLDGRADLTPPEQEKATKLAEALGMRPELKLEIHGVIERTADGLALRTARLDELIEQGIGETKPGSGGDTMYAKRRTELIEKMFTESAIAEDPKAVLVEMRLRFTSETPKETGKPGLSFDQLAYTAELRRQLIDAQTLEEGDFMALAEARAAAIKAGMIESNASIEPQISVGNPQAIETVENEPVRMKVILTAGQ